MPIVFAETMRTSKDQLLRLLRLSRCFFSWILLFSFWFAATTATAEEHDNEPVLFPPNDEYDAMILDPNTIYGSPNGGFSRATASRLSSMPLKLPPIIAEDDDEMNSDDSSSLYFRTRDMYGRLFVCHTLYHYHHTEEEDENNSSKNHWMRLNDSLFAPPIYYYDGDENANYNHNRRSHNVRNDRYESSSSTSSSKNSDAVSMVDRIRADPVGVAEDIIRRIDKLKGVCAHVDVDEEIRDNDIQVKMTYEWCYEKAMKQTLKKISPTSTTYRTYSLGNFETRQILLYISLEDLDGDDKNHYIDHDQEEVARIQDDYKNGDRCPGLGARRQTKVTYQCCSPDIIQDSQSTIFYENDPSTPVTDIELSLHIEVKDGEGTNNDGTSSISCAPHNFIICTPMLCDGYEEKKESVTEPNEDDNDGPHDYEHMSIREIIQKRFKPKSSSSSSSSSLQALLSSALLATDKKVQPKPCIYYETSGWWSYEFCPGDAIRQFHIAMVIDSSTGLSSYEKQDEYVLGRYQELGSSDDEWNSIVNGTDKSGFSSSSNPTTTTSGTTKANQKQQGPFYFEEYTGGDLCDLDEIAAESGRIGGGTSRKQIERAATVKYQCGKTLQMNIKEDSTCHYIVDVAVPELCQHPLFRQPVLKTPFIRCLRA